MHSSGKQWIAHINNAFTSFTNVAEMESLNVSEDPKDFDDFSLNSFQSDRDRDSVSSDLRSFSDSEGDIQFTEGPSVRRNVMPSRR
ncbi:hypothetical protein TNIN_313311 [Trichonephila inaurata madagascariensis]|uniref:Uncharacterized protein n=1 Tax=Trichonephila inaurata madagascariensis TaxID=2747483 RepID=A0A8X6YJI8_9ARAC|nr:hypothetical protein TNIN_313311 [Trichonephila inaurata madagascariensis]